MNTIDYALVDGKYPEKSETPTITPIVNIQEIINDAMEKKDRTVHIFISNVGTTVDVEPIRPEKKAEWVRERTFPTGNHFEYICSECGRSFSYITPYCPHCGEKLSVPVHQKEDK